MPRLKNKVTGVRITVDDALAAKLYGDWERVDEAPKPARRTRKKAAESDDE
ncbi:DUF7302 family protein [Rhodococcus sp. 5G237]